MKVNTSHPNSNINHGDNFTSFMCATMYFYTCHISQPINKTNITHSALPFKWAWYLIQLVSQYLQLAVIILSVKFTTPAHVIVTMWGNIRMVETGHYRHLTRHFYNVRSYVYDGNRTLQTLCTWYFYNVRLYVYGGNKTLQTPCNKSFSQCEVICVWWKQDINTMWGHMCMVETEHYRHLAHDMYEAVQLARNWESLVQAMMKASSEKYLHMMMMHWLQMWSRLETSKK